MGGDFGWSILPVSRSLRTYNNNYIRESSEERYPISGNEYSVNNCPELRNLFKTIAERLIEIFPSLCPVYIEFHTAKICVWLVLLCLRSRFREIAIASKRRQLAFTCERIPYLYTQSWTQCDCDLVIKIAAMNLNARCHHNIVDIQLALFIAAAVCRLHWNSYSLINTYFSSSLVRFLLSATLMSIENQLSYVY